MRAEARPQRLLGAVDRAVLFALQLVRVGIGKWREKLLASFDQPTTNRSPEEPINKAEVITRRLQTAKLPGLRRGVLTA